MRISQYIKETIHEISNLASSSNNTSMSHKCLPAINNKSSHDPREHHLSAKNDDGKFLPQIEVQRFTVYDVGGVTDSLF